MFAEPGWEGREFTFGALVFVHFHEVVRKDDQSCVSIPDMYIMNDMFLVHSKEDKEKDIQVVDSEIGEFALLGAAFLAGFDLQFIATILSRND